MMKKMDENPLCINIKNFTGPDDLFDQQLTRKQALLRSTPPKGSLAKAIQMTKIYFPELEVVSAFADIPGEYVKYFPLMVGIWNDQYVLTAFIYRYHPHVMRHGVYLKVRFLYILMNKF